MGVLRTIWQVKLAAEKDSNNKLTVVIARDFSREGTRLLDTNSEGWVRANITSSGRKSLCVCANSIDVFDLRISGNANK